MEHKVIVGLEIHVHLATRTKMFCGCELVYGGEANSRVCPVCIGMPGVLPVMNKKAYECAVLTALALKCRIARFTKWDRKSYYYPDLPKNYQISQYDLPLGEDGYIEIPLEDGATKKVGIIRTHLEEDAGKNVHTMGNFSGVDLNRAGSPLLEIVTAPDMNSAGEVRALAIELQKTVRYLGVSEGDMQKGHMRFEPNVNLHIVRNGEVYKTPISEIKNLNSFRAVERSVEYEVARQLEEFAETGVTMQMGNKRTFGWDDEHQVTVIQREKEEAHDYRYFPEPDLVPVEMDDEWLGDIRARLCELPIDMRRRFVDEYGLSDYDAGVVTGERGMAEIFDGGVNLAPNAERRGYAKKECNILTQDYLKQANERGCTVRDLGLTSQKLFDLAKMLIDGTIGSTAVATIADISIGNPSMTMTEITTEHDLRQTSDAVEIEGLVDEVIAANPDATAEITSGGKKSKKAMGFLMGQVMQKSKGQANPQVVSEIMKGKLGMG